MLTSCIPLASLSKKNVKEAQEKSPAHPAMGCNSGSDAEKLSGCLSAPELCCLEASGAAERALRAREGSDLDLHRG